MTSAEGRGGMTIRRVLQLGNPLLREVAEAVDDPSVGAAFSHV